ncbi:hydroxyacid dehydrogenase [Arthrobacter sp. ISL-5]|uniref:hydroxyacid dehydrogenase n=1 Tax=Arthrobacter sp. ISL-5 TaxID=2819111 RepID=UPI002036094E|nr:hydroxyacid dehydrogenase [Arthrobacter sp. ISL-5]
MNRAMADGGSPHRPRVAFAMASNELRDSLINAESFDRLRAVADVLSTEVLTDFESVRAREVLAHATALITGWGSPRIDGSVLDLSPGLRLVAHAAGTVKNHVSPVVWDRGVLVTTAAQANAVPVAEYALAFILLAGKDAFASQARQRLEQSRYRKEVLRQDLGNNGNTVGIIGASRTGRLLIELLKPYPLRILLADPTLTPAAAASLGAELVPLDQLMRRSKVVSLHAPVLPSTLGMIGAAELAQMQDGSTFINTARGVLVDHAALRAELRRGRISAVLDVTAPEPLPDGDELYKLPNVVLTPHIAGSLGNELARMGSLAVAEVERLAQGAEANHAISRETLAAMA